MSHARAVRTPARRRRRTPCCPTLTRMSSFPRPAFDRRST
jgi:hypothetical protein